MRKIELMAVALVVALVLSLSPGKADGPNKLGKLECEGLTVLDKSGKPRIQLHADDYTAGVWLTCKDGGSACLYTQGETAVIGLYSKQGERKAAGHDIAIASDKDGARLQLNVDGRVEIISVKDLVAALELARKPKAKDAK